jgi:VCBS repeat-containing protein
VITQPRSLAFGAALALLAGLSTPADAKTRADCEREYAPQRAQEGKDVIWAPTPDSVVVRMLEMAQVTPADKLYDLGAGDGVITIAAGKNFVATAVGVEYDADLVKHAQCLAEAEGVQDRVTFVQGDIFEADFSDASVVALYLVTRLNVRLRPTLLAMKPGTRVVSYSFTMGDWQPDHFEDTDEGSAYLWIVPANVHGNWTLRPRDGGESFDVELEQTYQQLRGRTRGERLTGKLTGDQVDFTFAQHGVAIRVTGTLDADRIVGTIVRGGVSTDYVATRS